MTEIGLQAYTDEAKELVRAGRYNEAITICRYILQQYPKHVRSYRVLAEACLEKGEHEEATDLFKRVLSADPEDVISYVGLGITYDEDGLLDEAIWQFERAFELSPGNAEIRRELKRLYTQRDGVEKRRLKLNRSCLGRLYLKGGFFAQAIAEFREILTTDPERIDIQLALAEALWRDNSKREAAEVCQDILNKMPHCLKANLLLGEIWLGSGLDEEGNTLLKRAQNLDPENVVAGELFGEASPLPRTTVTIRSLEEQEITQLITPAAAKEEELPVAAESAAELLPAMEAAEELAPTAEAPVEKAEVVAEGAEEESPVIAALEEEFGALLEIGLEKVGAEERAAIEATMPPETATPEEIIAWLRQRQARISEEAPLAVIGEAEPKIAEEIRVEEKEAKPELLVEAEKPLEAIPEKGIEPAGQAVLEEMAHLEAGEVAMPMEEVPPETAAEMPALEAPMTEEVGLAAAEEGIAAALGEVLAREVAEEVAVPEPEAEKPLAEAIMPEEVKEKIAAEGVEAEKLPEEAAVTAEVGEKVLMPELEVERPPAEAVVPMPPEAAPTIEGYLAKLESKPEDHTTRLALARAYAEAGVWDKSVGQYKQLVRSNPEMLNEVIADLEKSTTEHPERLELHEILGDAYMEAGRLQEALAKYNWLLSKV